MKGWKKLSTWKKALAIIAMTMGSYLLIGYLCHLVIFPEQLPDNATYFQPGDVFESEWEGFRQTVIRQEGGKVYCKLELQPLAEGPPLHIHRTFDELFENGDQPISVVLNRDTIDLQPFESLHIPKGTPHKPFNPHPTLATLTMNEFAFPEKFAVYLIQVYGFMDESEDNRKPPKALFQMAMFNQHFDSFLADQGPPVPIQRLTNFLMVPLARLMGYKSYYSKYGIQR